MELGGVCMAEIIVPIPQLKCCNRVDQLGHSAYNSLQFFQWLVMLQYSCQSYSSKCSETIVSEAEVADINHLSWIHIKLTNSMFLLLQQWQLLTTRGASDTSVGFTWKLLSRDHNYTVNELCTGARFGKEKSQFYARFGSFLLLVSNNT